MTSKSGAVMFAIDEDDFGGTDSTVQVISNVTKRLEETSTTAEFVKAASQEIAKMVRPLVSWCVSSRCELRSRWGLQPCDFE